MEDSAERTRVVLLGASNLALAFPHVVGRIRARLGGPIEVLAALGHGRSYGSPSSFLFRELPGIDGCGLWAALERGSPPATVALVADLGNDLVYGSAVGEVAGWLERALARLRAGSARTVLVRMPLSVVDRLSPLRFRIARGIFFPGRRIDLPGIRERVRALDARMEALARSHGAEMVEQRDAWYGLDPVHIRRSRRAEAWDTWLDSLDLPSRDGDRRGLSSPERRALRRAGPEVRRLLGRLERRQQPSARLPDGTTISLY